MYRKKQPEYRFETYRRTASDGRRIIYVRFLDEAGEILTTRSTGEEDQGAASAVIMRFMREIDLEEIAARRQDKTEKAQAIDERLASMPLAEFFAWFWGPESHHVKDSKAAGAKLSSDYITEARRYVSLYVESWPAFRDTPLCKASFRGIDGFFRDLRDRPQIKDPSKTISRASIDGIRNALRVALNWAAARGYCEKIEFSGLKLPPSEAKERGLLTDEEVTKLLALPTQQLWRETSGEKRLRIDVKPRPKLKGFKDGAKNEGATLALDVRMKAFVLLGPFLGFRRGEERGLRWRSIDLDAGLVHVENNFVDRDGDKDPKRKSFRTLPIAPELEVVLWELKEFAKALGLDKPDDYILFNPADPSIPAQAPTLRRGWIRAMRAIGVSDEERRRRNLVPHGTRHRFATKLLESGMTPKEAQALTGHKTLEMLERYSAHVSAETMAKAVEAVRGREKEKPRG